MNTVIKRIVCGFLAFLVLLVSVIIPDFSSFAEEVNNNVTFGDLIYGYNENDVLSNYNYLNYFNYVDGYLKYCGQSIPYYLNNNDVDFGSTLETNVLAHLNDTSTNNIRNTVFADVDGIKFTRFSWWRSDYETHLMNCTVVGNGDFVCVNGVWVSDSPFDIYTVTYTVLNHGVNGYVINNNDLSPSDAIEPQYILHATLDNQLNKYVYDYSGFYLYCEIPYYMIAYKNDNYTDGDFLVDQYGYDDWRNVYNAIGTDTTGFVIDRRTQKMIDSNGGGTSVDPQNYGFQQGSFAAQVYGSTFNDQKLFVAYQLNEPSATIQNDLYLRLDYQFDFDGGFDNYMLDYSNSYHGILNYYDMYSLADTNYINIDLDNVYSKMLDVDATLVRQYNSIKQYLAPTSFTPGSTGAIKLGVSPLDCFNILRDNNILTEAPVARNYQNEPLIESLAGSYKDFNFSVGINTNAIYTSSGVPLISRLDSCLLTVTMSIYNVSTGENGSVFLYSYDYKNKSAVTSGSLENNGTFGGTYSNGAQSGLNNPNSSELGYNISNGVQYPVTSGSSSSGNSVVVNQSPYPYVLVDIPENEWMNYTPNLKSLLDTYKDALSTTKEDSILPLIAQTYNYLPSEAMQYLIYGVGIIVMIGIWRAITRR